MPLFVFWISLFLNCAFLCLMIKKAETIIIAGIFVLAIFESIVGICQLAGFQWFANSYYNLTGTFDNPGPYGCFIAVAMALAISSIILHGRAFLSTATLLLGAFILPSTQSRTAWIALLGSLLVLLLRTPFIKRRLIANKPILVLFVSFALVVMATPFALKKDSALGRLHIWNIECKVIQNNLATGVGLPFIMGAFGQEQSDYFRKKERSSDIIRVAGCPQHAYSEYLRFGMAYGIVGLFLSLTIAVSLIVILLKNQSLLGYGAVVWTLVATASYPLEVWQLSALLAVLTAYAFSCFFKNNKRLPVIILALLSFISIVGTGLEISNWILLRRNERAWKITRTFIATDETAKLSLYEKLYNKLADNEAFLFDYGRLLHAEGLFEYSNEILKEGSRLSSDLMFLVLMGKNHLQLGNNEEAENCFWDAHWRVPSRLYPLLLLMDLYEAEKRIQDAINIGETALQMPVNPKNKNMVRLHKQLSMKLLTLKNSFLAEESLENNN